MNNYLNGHSTTVSSAARGLLVANGLLVYNEPYLEPDFTKSAEIGKPRIISMKPDESLLKVYPNPAHDFITIEYNTGNDKSQGLIEIIDESGKRVYNRNLGRQFDQIIIDTRNFKAGNYIIRLFGGSKPFGISRFVISK